MRLQAEWLEKRVQRSKEGRGHRSGKDMAHGGYGAAEGNTSRARTSYKCLSCSFVIYANTYLSRRQLLKMNKNHKIRLSLVAHTYNPDTLGSQDGSIVETRCSGPVWATERDVLSTKKLKIKN